MFNFSANHLILLSRTEYQKCAVLLLRDLDTHRVYRFYHFTKALLLRPGVAYSVAGKVNSADKVYLVIESVRLDTKHSRNSTAHAPVDGAGGFAYRLTNSAVRHRAVPRRAQRPAPPHSCVSRSRPAAIPMTRPAILRVFYIGTNSQIVVK
jgi:hypothetical protein